MREISSRDRSIASLIFGFLLACYLLTFTGYIQSSDGLAMFATVESMVRRGEIDSNQLLWMDLQQGSYGPDGELYSRKGLGMPLLAFPLVWIAQVWPALGLVQTALLLNPILTAWTGALVFRTGRRLEWGRTPSIATALAFGLATMAWPYTQTFFSDPMAAWGLFGAFYGILSYRQTSRKRYLLLSGIAWGISYLSRVVNLVTLPIYLVLLVTVLVRSIDRSLRPNILKNLRAVIIYNWRAFTSFLFPIIAAGLASLWWNWTRYGSLWDSGYIEAETFSADWLFGISGLLFGPARGLIWYAPILILAIPGSFWFWREKRWILISILSISALFVLLYGKWFMWHGGFSWGPRFLIVVLPFLTLLTGPIFQKVFGADPDSATGKATAITKALIIILVVLSVLVQWLGMLAPFGLVQDQLANEVQPLFAPQTFTDLGYSPLVRQWQFIQGDTIPFAWWNSDVALSIDWLALLISLAGITGGIVLILRQINETESSSEPMADSSIAPSESEQVSPRYWIYSAALILITLALLTNYRVTQADEQIHAVTEIIDQNARSDDAILHLQPMLTQAFANQYHGTLPVYGLFNREALNQVDEQWLNHLRQNYRRLWVFSAPGMPESSGWERSLRTNDFLLDNGNIKTVPEQRVPLYALSQPDAMVEHGVGAIFGKVAEGESLTDENGSIRLNGYAALPMTNPGGEVLLTLRWESIKAVEQNYHVFVHVLEEDGDIVAQRDGQPAQWMRPISTWQPGEVIVDRYGLFLPDDVEPGKYRLSIGLYDPVSGSRLPVNTNSIENAVELQPFDIVP